jgi:proton-dependent oligopeptide transporter, POT family
MDDDIIAGQEAALAPGTAAAKASKRDRAFIGHPVGLGWLSASEFWERFAYYGTTSFLVLYLAHHLLQPGIIEHVWGFAYLRAFVEMIYGAQTTPDALAATITGLYSAVVYVTPLLGGFLADRVLGRTVTVALGAILMVAGEFLLALDATFAIAILVLLIGVGCFKGNIAAQVGDLYSHEDHRRADGFQIYFLGIQIAVIIAPILCGWLGQEEYGWHPGFLAAGGAMVLGLVIYFCGLYSYPKETSRKEKADAPAQAPLARKDWIVVAILVVLVPVLALTTVSNQEIFNGYLLWAERTYDLVFFGYTIPVPFMISVDAIVSTVLMIGVIAFWRWYSKRWSEPSELTKIIIGTAITTTAPLVLAGASAVAASTGQPVSLGWAIAFHGLNDLGFANVFPVGLALYSRAAPKGLGGILIAIYYFHLFFGNLLVGKIAALLDTMSAVSFWLLHSAIMVVSIVILVVVKLAFGRLLAPGYGHAASSP